MKKALFLHFLRSLLITYLLNLKSEKINYCLEKSREKVLSFGSKKLYQPCIYSQVVKGVLCILFGYISPVEQAGLVSEISL